MSAAIVPDRLDSAAGGDPVTGDKRRGLLRFATAGSVDDGKSTLVGRLLHDSKSVLADQLEAVTATSAARGLDAPDLSLLVDGLRAEREQGITIDVAYRYFATPERTFILADTPGHEQYTRNTVTGASTADVVVILTDARTGVVAQTRRHATVAALVGVRHLLLAVNKIDLVGYDEATFRGIADEFAAYATGLGIPEVTAIPISALHGDNVVSRSERIGWYSGPSVLEHLELLDLAPAGTDGTDGIAGPDGTDGTDGTVGAHDTDTGLRFPVQYVIRPGTAEHPDYRGYAGRVAAGTVRPGDEVVTLPSGRRSTVLAIDTADGERPFAGTGDSVTLLLADDIDISRGELIASPAGAPEPVTTFAATVTVLADRPLRAGARLLVRYGTTATRAVLASVDSLLDIDTLTSVDAPEALRLNDIAQITVRVAEPLPVEDFRPGGAVGALLLIDQADGTTLAAGMVGDRPAALRGGRCRPTPNSPAEPSALDPDSLPTPGP